MIGFSSCNNSTPDDNTPTDEEVYSVMLLQFTPSNGGTDTINYYFSDPDGVGGTDAFISSGTLQANTSYDAILTLTNSTVDPAVDMSAIVLAAADSHQVFYAPNNTNLSVDYLDQDSNGKPIGLSTRINTGSPSTGGFMMVALRSNPDKNADGVAQGDISNAGGTTDIEVIFEVTIE